MDSQTNQNNIDRIINLIHTYKPNSKVSSVVLEHDDIIFKSYYYWVEFSIHPHTVIQQFSVGADQIDQLESTLKLLAEWMDKMPEGKDDYAR